MQVSQVAEQENFVVAGGGQARAFKIGNSASAFKILSDTLYSDKHRAVAREVLCNAVDAHIVSGKTDTPVEVKLSDFELSIKDFGPGIADDRMVDIYATYFGSTKQNDDTQTGGFGLGSKSPFAYNDHFTVTSCHAGFRRIYALHVGDDETDGAPAVKLMATAPCGDETGVMVSVPLKVPADRSIFERHLRQVARDGGMKVTLNGEAVFAYDYTELRRVGIGLFGNQVENSERYHSNRSAARVLYGNVLYPLDERHAELSDLFRKLNEWAYSGFTLIIHVPPSSVTVTPARESLAYNPRTIATLNRTIGRALHKMNAARGKLGRKACVEAIEREKMSRATIFVALGLRNTEFQSAALKVDSYVGTDAIAELHARSSVAMRNYPREKFLDIAGRYFGDKRMRLLDPVQPSTWNWSHKPIAERMRMRLKGVEENQEQHRYISQKLLRVVPSELWGKLYYMHRNQSGLTHLTKGHRNYRSMATEANLIIAPTRDTIAANSSKRGYFLVDNKITPEQIEAIKTAAAQHRIKVETLERIIVEKKPRKKKDTSAEPLYRALGCGPNYRYPRGAGGNKVRELLPPTINTPAAFLHWSPSRYKEVGLAVSEKGNTHSLFEKINAEIPNTVLAIGLKEAETLREQGVPSVEDIVLGRLETALANQSIGDSLFIAMLSAAKGGYNNELADLFEALLSLNARCRCAAFGISYEKYTNSTIDGIWKFARDLFSTSVHEARSASSDRFNNIQYGHDAQRHQDLIASAKKTVDPWIKEVLGRYEKGALTEKQLPHLAFLAKLGLSRSYKWQRLDDEDQNRLAELIEAEYRRVHSTEFELNDNGDQL